MGTTGLLIFIANCSFVSVRRSNHIHFSARAGNPGVDKIALQEEKVLLEQRNDHYRIFAALTFVNGDTVSKLHFGKFAFAIFDNFSGKFNGYGGAVCGNGADNTGITIEHVFVIVVATLNYLIANAIDGIAMRKLKWQGLSDDDGTKAHELVQEWHEHVDM